MNTKPVGALCARKMQIEYTKTRKRLIKDLKKRQSQEAVKSIINESVFLLDSKLSNILTLYIAKAFRGGKRDAESELKDIVRAAAPSLSLSDPALEKVTHTSIGSIGKYNLTLNKTLIKEYDTLLSDNKLANSLKTDGWSPWMDASLKKRGIDPKVISLIKHQTTSAKMVSIINQQGIRGGLHPDQVGRRLEPFVNRYFGPGGVEIDNIGKTVKRIHVDADGNYAWKNHKVTRKYKATTKTYSRAIAQNSMKQAHQEAYYQSLQKTGLVDHYISVSVLDSRTCGICAMLHGQRVTRGTGPQYHSTCHCDLAPVWKKDSLLGDRNKDDSYYANRRDRHFLAVNDLKRYNAQMPRGSMVKHYTMLLESARTTTIPEPSEMRAIRNALLGGPKKIGPKLTPKPKQIDQDFDEENWGLTDDEWKAEADKLWDKTQKDGNEHLAVFNGLRKEFSGTKNGVKFSPPERAFSSLHTHPNWDSPLSPGDLSDFIESRYEKFSGAASKKAIYIVRKRPGYKHMSFQTEVDKFQKEFDRERKRLIKVWYKEVKTRGHPDQTEMILKAGEHMCKKYGLDYKVIKRKP